jgi:hypothetical protein
LIRKCGAVERREKKLRKRYEEKGGDEKNFDERIFISQLSDNKAVRNKERDIRMRMKNTDYHIILPET